MRVSTSPVDATARDRYNRHYGGLDKVMARLSRSRAGSSFGCYELVDRDELLRSEFYADWLRGIDLGDGLFLVLRRDASAMTTLSIGAPLRCEAFATAERKRMTELLSPHIRQALVIQSRLAMADAPFLECARAGHLEHPVAFVGDGGRLVHCSPRFVSVIEHAGVSVFRGRIQANGFAELAAIERALARALGSEDARTGSSVILGPGKPFEIKLHFIPLGESLLSAVWLDARALVIAEPRAGSASAAWLRAAFGLTDAEATLALLIASEPLGLRSIAGSLGVATSTVKTHLQHIFEKTGTSRQADLVRLIVQAGTPAEPPVRRGGQVSR